MVSLAPLVYALPQVFGILRNIEYEQVFGVGYK